jgi:hypothetical protein
MKIAVFTSNLPRHLSLVETMAGIADEVFAIQECRTIRPGEVDGFIRQSATMQRYFTKVNDAERQVFGDVRFLPGNVRQLALERGDLQRSGVTGLLAPALTADVIVVFGASYIKSPLIEALVGRRAVNIHMGLSPYYRGNSCNFWAIRDGRPDLVGATIHMLSKGLDSGAILFHALPEPAEVDGFLLGMRAVRAAHLALARRIADGSLFAHDPVPQDRGLEKRYTRAADFTDADAEAFLADPPAAEAILRGCQSPPEARQLVQAVFAA